MLWSWFGKEKGKAALWKSCSKLFSLFLHEKIRGKDVLLLVSIYLSKVCVLHRSVYTWCWVNNMCTTIACNKISPWKTNKREKSQHQPTYNHHQKPPAWTHLSSAATSAAVGPGPLPAAPGASCQRAGPALAALLQLQSTKSPREKLPGMGGRALPRLRQWTRELVCWKQQEAALFWMRSWK